MKLYSDKSGYYGKFTASEEQIKSRASYSKKILIILYLDDLYAEKKDEKNKNLVLFQSYQ